MMPAYCEKKPNLYRENKASLIKEDTNGVRG